MVLRAANATQQTLTAFTDHRSAKAFELAHHPKALFVFWSDRLKWQLRVRALVTVQTSGPEVDAVWQRVQQSAAAGDYLAPTAPGTQLAQPDAGTAPQAERHHLAILTAQVTEIDWLELSAWSPVPPNSEPAMPQRALSTCFGSAWVMSPALLWRRPVDEAHLPRCA